MQHRSQQKPPGFPMFAFCMLGCLMFMVAMAAAFYGATILILYPLLSTSWIGGLFVEVVVPGPALISFIRHREDRILPGLIIAGWATGLVLGCFAIGT